MSVSSIGISITTALVVAACTVAGVAGRPTPSATTATAVLRDPTGRQVGAATLVDTYAGVLLTGTISGIGVGAHGIHVHETGKCEAPFTSAGGHYNPGKRRHGFKNPEGHHAGDMPNIDAPATGELKFEIRISDVSLTATNRLLDEDGAALVIHGAGDDYSTDPSGNSGSRIVCGVINTR